MKRGNHLSKRVQQIDVSIGYRGLVSRSDDSLYTALANSELDRDLA